MSTDGLKVSVRPHLCKYNCSMTSELQEEHKRAIEERDADRVTSEREASSGSREIEELRERLETRQNELSALRAEAAERKAELNAVIRERSRLDAKLEATTVEFTAYKVRRSNQKDHTRRGIAGESRVCSSTSRCRASQSQ